MATEDLSPSPERRFRFDLAAARLLIGSDAFEAHVNAGNHPADIKPLGPLLRQPNVRPLADPPPFPALDAPTTYAHARWLATVSPPTNPLQEPLNRTMLKNGQRLGVSFHTGVIRDISGGNYSRFYRDAGVPGRQITARSGREPRTISESAILDQISEAVRFYGREPSEMELRDYARKRGGFTPDQINQSGHGKTGQFIERVTGLVRPRHWGVDEYANWTVRFMVANGRQPTRRELNILSKERGSAPSPSTVYENPQIGSLRNLQRLGREAYEQRRTAGTLPSLTPQEIQALKIDPVRQGQRPPRQL